MTVWWYDGMNVIP